MMMMMACRFDLIGVAEYGLVKLLKEAAAHLSRGQDRKSFTCADMSSTSVRNAVHCVGQVSAYLLQVQKQNC